MLITYAYIQLIANYSDLQEQKTAAAAAASTANAATTSPPNAVSGGTSVLATTSSAVDSKGPIPAPPVPVGRQRSMDEKEYQVTLIPLSIIVITHIRIELTVMNTLCMRLPRCCK
ncbi:hypothetical protein EON64_11550 [archaeon]|nr:MAG: hypothetical protein EON64_11550 [archaeon]